MAYIPLEPLPNVPQDGSATFCTLLNGLFRLLIIIGGLLAVGSFVYAGVMYMVSEATGTKSAARKGIETSMWGLLLLISSYIILNTINPQLISCNNALNPINGLQTIAGGQTQTTPIFATQVDGVAITPTILPPDNNAAVTAVRNAPTGMSTAAQLAAASADVAAATAVCLAAPGGAVSPGELGPGLGCIQNTTTHAYYNSTTKTLVTTNACANIATPSGNKSCFYNQ